MALIPSTTTVAILISRSKVFWVMRLLVSVDGHGSLFFESFTVGFDKLDAVDDHLVSAAVFALVGFPFGLLQEADNSHTGAGMEVFLCNFGVLVETDALDPSGLVSARFEGQ